MGTGSRVVWHLCYHQAERQTVIQFKQPISFPMIHVPSATSPHHCIKTPTSTACNSTKIPPFPPRPQLQGHQSHHHLLPVLTPIYSSNPCKKTHTPTPTASTLGPTRNGTVSRDESREHSYLVLWVGRNAPVSTTQHAQRPARMIE